MPAKQPINPAVANANGDNSAAPPRNTGRLNSFPSPETWLPITTPRPIVRRIPK